MNGIPRAALRLIEEAPHLIMLNDERGDLFSLEQWGAVFGPEINGFSPHRYMLWRVFDEQRPLLVVIMLNPSKATHLTGDRTIDGLIRRARAMGYGGILVVNCFAWRATDPADMKREGERAIGEENDLAIAIAVDQDLDVLCAWGVNAMHLEREKRVRCLISEGRAKPHWLRLCGGGAPEHPLYLPSALGLTPWSDMQLLD